MYGDKCFPKTICDIAKELGKHVSMSCVHHLRARRDLCDTGVMLWLLAQLLAQLC